MDPACLHGKASTLTLYTYFFVKEIANAYFMVCRTIAGFANEYIYGEGWLFCRLAGARGISSASNRLIVRHAPRTMRVLTVSLRNQCVRMVFEGDSFDRSLISGRELEIGNRADC